jgi:hypothetical protein
MLPLWYFLDNEIATDSLILGLECNFPGWIADPQLDTSRLSFFTTRLKFTDRLTASDRFWPSTDRVRSIQSSRRTVR